MSEPRSSWFSKFEKSYRDDIHRMTLHFSADGRERMLAYRVLSDLEKLTSRLWRVMRAVEEGGGGRVEHRRENNLA